MVIVDSSILKTTDKMAPRKTPETDFDNVECSDALENERKDSGISEDLLKNFDSDVENDCKNDSGNDTDSYDTNNSKDDYKSLISALSTCCIDDNKNETDKKAANKTNDGKSSSKQTGIKLHLRVKKKVSSTKNDKKDCSSSNDAEENVDKLTEKLSSMKIPDARCEKEKKREKQKQTEKVSASTSKLNKSHEKKTKSKTVYLERGPIKTNDNKAKPAPYTKEIHRNILSGGQCIAKEESVLVDVFPTTIDNDLILNLNTNIPEKTSNHDSSFVEETVQQTFQYTYGTIHSLPQNIIQTKEITDKTQKNNELFDMIEELVRDEFKVFDTSDMYNMSNSKISNVDIQQKKELQPILHFLNSSSLSLPQEIPNILVNDEQIYGHSDFNSPGSSIQASPNQRQSYSSSYSEIFVGGPNPSPSENSPFQGFQSPSAEILDRSVFNDNIDLYDSPINPMISRVSRPSYSTISSPSDSPRFQVSDNFTFSRSSSQYDIQSNTSYDYNESNLNSPAMSSPDNNIYHSSSSNDIFNDLNSFHENHSDVGTTVSAYEKSPQYTLNFNNNEVLVNKHQSVKSVKSAERHLIPIASKTTPFCCVEYNKTATERLQLMFERLDNNMQRDIVFKIHSLNNEKLKESFDGLLSSWNNSGSQYARLSLLYVTCERLLMCENTMEKFLDVYRNGFTVLNRAVLTCSQSPLVVQYLAECMIKAISNIQHPVDFSLDKKDIQGNTVLHHAASRGEQCAMSLAALLTMNKLYKPLIFDVNQKNNDGSSPLHIACSRHEKAGCPCPCQMTVHVLLKHGQADPNIKDSRSGNTALHLSVDAGACAPNLILLLLQYKAKASIKNYSGNTALDLARAASHSNIQYPKQVIDILKKAK